MLNRGKKKKTILIISALDIWSIGENKGAPSLWKTLKGYADSDWKVFFLTGNRDKNSIYEIHRNIKIIRFDFPGLKKFFNIKKVGFIAKSIWWLYFQIKTFLIGLKLNRKEKIDVLYGYEICGVPVAKFLSKVLKKPVISRFQGTILAPWIGKKFWKVRLWQHILALKMPVNLLIMTNDGTQGDKVLSRLNVDMEKVKFWINGIDKDTYTYISNFDKEKFKKKLGIKKNTKILLMVSRLENWKRVDRMIKAMPEITKKYQNIKLLIIGDGSEIKNLENLTKRLMIENYIRFLGALSHKELKNYYNLADIFISLYDLSNVGNPLFEAMSCGKCIITIDVGDTNKFIFNSKNGILLKKEEVDKLPEIIINLLKNDEYREKLGKNAREFAEKNFWTWEERMEAEIKEVEKLLLKK